MKKLIILTSILLLLTDIAYCYTGYKLADFRYYNNGTYENMNNRPVKEYKNNYERNKYELNDRTYCYIPIIKGDKTPDMGYYIKRDRHNVVGYLYRESFMRIERVPCHAILSNTPVVRSFEEARHYKD